MKKFKFIIEGVVSPGNAILGGGSSGEGEGPPSKGKGTPGEGKGTPGEGKGTPGEGKGTPAPLGKGNLPVNDMKEGPVSKGLPGSDVPNDEKTDKESESEIMRKAHDHVKQVEAEKQGNKAVTSLGETQIPEADWRSILQDMLGSFQPRGNRSYTKSHRGNASRLSMGSSAIPGHITGTPTVGNIVIGIDTSGSITAGQPPMLETFMGAIVSIAEEHQDSLGIIRIVFYSGDVWHYIDFDPSGGDKDPTSMIETVKPTIETGYSGGNDWGATMEGMFEGGFKDSITNEHVNFDDTSTPMDQFHGFIFLTDCVEGGFKNSYLPDAPTVFLIPTGGHNYDSESLPFVRWALDTGSNVEVYSINLDK